MIQELRQVLRQIKIARTGYMYIFDSKRDMIIHSDANIEKTNIAALKDPTIGRSADELISASGNANITSGTSRTTRDITPMTKFPG